jgi:lipoprotein-releasing system permease protein
MPFGVQTWEQVRAEYLRAVNTEKVMLLVVLSFIVLLAGFTILATLTLTVVEKTKDIGVVKALGGTTGGILSIFLRSGLLIGLVGGALGVVLGLFVTAHANTINRTLESMGIPIFPPNVYLFREIPTHVDPASVAGIAIGSAVIAFLAGLLPALRAARMDPVNALRYE